MTRAKSTQRVHPDAFSPLVVPGPSSRGRRKTSRKAHAKLLSRVLAVLDLCGEHLFQGACFISLQYWRQNHPGSNFCRFCSRCLENSVTGAYCRRSILSSAYASLQTGEPHYSRCWLGLNTVTVAVAPRGHLMGAVEMGGYHFNEDRAENRAFIEANLRSLGSAADGLLEAEPSLASVLPGEIRGAADFLFDSLFSLGVNSVEHFRENYEKYLQQRRIGERMQLLGGQSQRSGDVFDVFTSLVPALKARERSQSMLLLDDFFTRALLNSGADTDRLKAHVLLLLSVLTREAVVSEKVPLAAATTQHCRMYRLLEQLEEPEDICYWAFKQVDGYMDSAADATLGREGELALAPRVLSWIESNFWKKATLQAVAQDIGASVSSIVQALREKTGQTFKQHLLAARMDEAKYLLAQSTVPLSEVALQCGFYDQSHFCRAFRKSFDQSPGQFRRKLRGNGS